MNHFIVFKKFDYTLNNKSLLLAEKIFALIELWNKLNEFDFSALNLNETINLVDWALLHTMNITLTAEWTHYMDLFEIQLRNSIQNASVNIIKVSKGFEKRFAKILYVVKETWSIPTLDFIIKRENVEISKEIIDFFNKEQAHLISVRLIKLCDSNCEDLAMNLATAFLKYLKVMSNTERPVQITADQISFIFDIRVSLLYKFGRLEILEKALKELSYNDAYACINRFLNKKPNLLKLWKNSQKIATIMMQILLEKIVVHNRIDQKQLLISILETYLSISAASDCLVEVCPKIKNICDLAESCMLQTICDVLKKVTNKDLYSFIVEIFIKTLTVDINELEAKKLKQQNAGNENIEEQKQTFIISSRLAELFCSLAYFLEDKVKVARECVLTAFSLHPTPERLSLLEYLAKRSGLPVIDLADPVINKTYSLDNQHYGSADSQEYMSKLQLDIPMKANLALHEASKTLDLPESICEDLIICISNPRYQVLSWYLPWMVLHRICVRYLKDFKEVKPVTKLNYLNIEYAQFKNIPKNRLDSYGGIEKGYEKYLSKDYVEQEDSEGEEMVNKNCAIDGDDYDPNSIESLKKILSLQNGESDDVDVETVDEIEAEVIYDKRNNLNSKTIITTSNNEEFSEKEKLTKGSKQLKRFCFFTKEKYKENLRKATGTNSDNLESPRSKIFKKSRCSIFGKKKYK